MRKAAHHSDGVDSSNPRRWRDAVMLHHHGGGVCWLFVLLRMDSWCHKLIVCKIWYKNNPKEGLKTLLCAPPRRAPHHRPFTLPTKTVLNALLVAATKWDINLPHSCWNYNWRTKATTDDLHHHRSMQVKRDDHIFSSRTVRSQRYTPQIKNSWHHFIYIDDYNIQQRMKQSGFNAEQIKRINIWRVKTVWRLDLK